MSDEETEDKSGYLKLAPTYEGLADVEKLRRGFKFDYPIVNCGVAGMVTKESTGPNGERIIEEFDLHSVSPFPPFEFNFVLPKPQTLVVDAEVIESTANNDGSYTVKIAMDKSTPLLDLLSAIKDPDRQVVFRLKKNLP